MDELREDTLAYILSRPAMCRLVMKDVSLKQVVANVENYEDSINTLAQPDVQAMEFYLADHLLATLQQRHTRNELLDFQTEALANSLYDRIADIGKRLFSYLLVICTRETRHVIHNDGFKSSHEAEFGDAIHNFLWNLKGLSSGEAVARLYQDAPDVPLVKYVEHMDHVFWKGDFQSSFGGPAWGSISSCLRRFVTGDISLALMADLGFALAHNGGPIFNKGRFFAHYSNEFITLLDIQRAGQVPNLVNSLLAHDPSVTGWGLDRFEDWYTMLAKACPGIANLHTHLYIDWHAVEAAGAESTNIGTAISKQDKWTAPDPTKKTSHAQATGGTSEEYVVTPGTTVKKVTRAQLHKAA